MDVYAPLTLQLVCTFFIATSWTAVGLRIWVRHFILHSFGKDDWAMLLTQIGLTIWYPSQMTAIHYGAGRHMWELSDRNATIALASIYFNEIFYFIVSVLVKNALCLFLLRIAKERIHVLILKNLMYGNIIIGGAFFFILTFQCWPIASSWNIDPLSAQDCVPPSVIVGLFYGMSALNIFSDWTIGILPFFMLRGLQIPLRQERIVHGILAFAAIGSSATVIRTPYLAGLADSYSGRGGDFTYKVGGILLWTCVELSVGIIAGSVVTLRPMIRAMFDRFGGSYRNRREMLWRPRVPTIGGTVASPRSPLHAKPEAWNGISLLSEFDMLSAGASGVVTTISGIGRSNEIVRPPLVWNPGRSHSPKCHAMPHLFKGRRWRRSEDDEEVVEDENPERLVVEVDREIEVSSHIEKELKT